MNKRPLQLVKNASSQHTPATASTSGHESRKIAPQGLAAASASTVGREPRRMSSRERSSPTVVAKDILVASSRYSQAAMAQKPRAEDFKNSRRAAKSKVKTDYGELFFQGAMQNPDMWRPLHESDHAPSRDINEMMQDPDIVRMMQELGHDSSTGSSSCRAQLPVHRPAKSGGGYSREAPVVQMFAEPDVKAQAFRLRAKGRREQEPEDALAKMMQDAEQTEQAAVTQRRQRGDRSLEELLCKVSSMVEGEDSDDDGNAQLELARSIDRAGARGRHLQQLLHREIQTNTE